MHKKHGYAMTMPSEGEMAEEQPHGGYNLAGDYDINGKGLEGDRDHPSYTGRHNPKLHRNRSLVPAAREPAGENTREASPKEGYIFRVPMRVDIEES